MRDHDAFGELATTVASTFAGATARSGNTRVLALDGPAGSGKTTLAGSLEHMLGCPVVHMDDLYAGWDGLAAAVPVLTHTVLKPLGRGEDVLHPCWDWAAASWATTGRRIPWTPELVVEGCGAAVDPAGSYAALRVWLDAPAKERRRRGLARDGEVFAPHWRRWAAQECALFGADRTRERAHLRLRT